VPTDAVTSPNAEKARPEPREQQIFLPLGAFWPMLGFTLATAPIAALLLCLWRIPAGVTLAICAVWSALFFGSLGVLTAAFAQNPMSIRLRVAAGVAGLLKFALFLAAAASVWRLQDFVPREGLVPWVLLGLHWPAVVYVVMVLSGPAKKAPAKTATSAATLSNATRR